MASRHVTGDGNPASPVRLTYASIIYLYSYPHVHTTAGYGRYPSSRFHTKLLFRQRAKPRPTTPRRLEQPEGPGDVRGDEVPGSQDRPVHVTLSREAHDRRRLIPTQGFAYERAIGNIPPCTNTCRESPDTASRFWILLAGIRPCRSR